MRTIGLIGGMSWESTAVYYRLINELTRARLGGLHSAPMVIESLDFADIEALQSAGDWETAGETLAVAARRLEAIGADLLVLATNTMHRVADAIAAATHVPLLHIADAAGEALGKAHLTRVGLLGTRFTMEEPFYRDRLANNFGLEVLVPDRVGRELVDGIIYDELCLGVVKESSREHYRDVMAALVDQGAQGIILGCTEIGLLVGPEDAAVPVLDTTHLHAEVAVQRALA